MKWMLAGAALAVSMSAFGGAAMAASMCANDCNRTFNQCNLANGANGQQACMPSWMQCKKACNGPTRTPTKVSNITPKPKK
jgi:hypothetical protein